MTDTQTHRSTLGAILSVKTGVLLCPLDEFYALQDFLVGRNLMTHERIVGHDRQVAALLEQFPQLAECEPPDFTNLPQERVEDYVRAWVGTVADHVGWTEADVQPVTGCEVDAGEALENMLSKLGSGR